MVHLVGGSAKSVVLRIPTSLNIPLSDQYTAARYGLQLRSPPLLFRDEAVLQNAYFDFWHDRPPGNAGRPRGGLIDREGFCGLAGHMGASAGLFHHGEDPWGPVMHEVGLTRLFQRLYQC